jgi:hypothetical protein
MQLRTLAVLLAGAIVVAAGARLVAGRLAIRIPPASADERGPAIPVLVELFTSEGCSSCPPAEEELLRIEREQPIDGARVIPVAFHVDYWNDLGWADPFSSAAWTRRQADYDRSRGGRVYTPQAIASGGDDCVGSNDGALQSIVRQAAYPGLARARVSLARASGATSPAGVRVSVTVSAMPSVTDVAEVRVILVESGVVVDVPRGENSGRHLVHAPLARDLVSAGVVSAPGGTFDASLTIPPAAHRDKLSAVAIVQERASHRVLGVETLALSLDSDVRR